MPVADSFTGSGSFTFTVTKEGECIIPSGSMANDDITLINRHLVELHQELEELRGAVDETAKLEREATLQEVYEVLGSAVDSLVQLKSGQGAGSTDEIASKLEDALPALGLTARFEAGNVVELWPEEVAEGLIVDRPVPSDAAMVRVEILANGWNRGRMVVARARGKVLDIINGEKDG
jgi:hypothetical protein